MTCSTKILFLDLDGTLLNDEKQITPGNLEAIHAAIARRHKVVVASGRATVSMLDLAQQMGLTGDGCYAITFNGACIYDLHRQVPVHRSLLPFETVRFILDEAYRHGIYAHTYSSDCVMAERKAPELLTYTGITHMTYQIVEDVCLALPEEPYKVIAINYDAPQKLAAFKEYIEKKVHGRADCFFSCPNYLEFVLPGVSKGSAIRELCRHLSVPIENTISAGDAENDISMLEATHISAIMKNAQDYMRPYGNYVTEHDNNHDGIAEIIYRFMIPDNIQKM